jgi:hypothetical protein
MSVRAAIVLGVAAVATSTCAQRAPRPPDLAPGTPYVSSVLMSGDRDNPDREFVCQSDPRSDCVTEASRADAQAFSDVHFAISALPWARR